MCPLERCWATTLMVPSYTIPTSIPGFNTPITASDLTMVNLTAGIPVSAGEKLAIVPSSNIGSLGWFGASRGDYIGGIWSYNIGSRFITNSPPGDFFFQTFNAGTSVPEPLSLALLGAGLGSLVVACRGRERASLSVSATRDRRRVCHADGS